MAESKIVHKDNHLIFEDGRFYVTETTYEAGKPSEFPREIDVTDHVKDAVRPMGFIDIDKFICGLACKLSARKKAGRGPEGLRISNLYQLLTELLAEHDVIYKDGSLIKIGESKKCEGTLGKMLKEKEPATNVEFSVWPKELVEDTVREAAENTDKVLDELGTHPLFKSVYDKGYENGKDETLKKALEWLQLYCSMYFRLDLDPMEECYCIKSDIAQLLNDLYKEIKGE